MTLPRYAFLGPEGSFTDAAMRLMVSPTDAEFVPMIDVPSALTAVREGECDFAVVAIENSVEGGVNATLDTLAQGSPLVILGEVILPVSFELVATEARSLESVSRVAAHSHALAQCRRWLHSNVSQALHVNATSNSAAAQGLVDGSVDYDAALAPPGTAERLGLHILASGVADSEHAATRFVRIGKPGNVPAPTGADRTTLVVHLPEDRAGALLEMLEQFAARGVNLSRIESRPIGDKPGQYSFSIDALAHISEARLQEALIGLKRTCPVVLFLGSYPAANANATPVSPGTSDADFAEARAWVESLTR